MYRINQIAFTSIEKKRGVNFSSAFVSFILDDLIHINSLEVKKFDSPNEYELLYPACDYHDQKIPCFIPINKEFENYLKQEIFRAYEAFLKSRS